MANWADLPHDVLEKISDFCCIISDAPGISPDYIRMQSVCKSWQSSLKKKSMRPELPWLMMLPNSTEEKEDPDARVFYSLSKQKIHTIPLPEIRGKRCCGSFQNGWLMIMDEKLDIFLFHPWTQKKIHLPHLSNFGVQDFRVGIYPMEQFRDKSMCKVAISDDAKVAMFIYGLGDLAFCRIGVDGVYTDVEGFHYLGDEGCPDDLSLVDAAMEDVIYRKGHFYTLSQAGAVYHIRFENDEDELLHASLERLTPDMDRFSYGHLVPDMLMADRLLVISRDFGGQDDYPNPPSQTRHFDIFGVEVSLEQGQGQGAHDSSSTSSLKTLTKVESLGDQVVFLGCNSPIVAMASQFPGLKGNCIYFTESYMETYYDSPQGRHDLGVFSLENGTVEKLFADRFHPNMSPPLWIATPPYSI